MPLPLLLSFLLLNLLKELKFVLILAICGLEQVGGRSLPPSDDYPRQLRILFKAFVQPVVAQVKLLLDLLLALGRGCFTLVYLGKLFIVLFALLLLELLSLLLCYDLLLE